MLVSRELVSPRRDQRPTAEAAIDTLPRRRIGRTQIAGTRDGPDPGQIRRFGIVCWMPLDYGGRQIDVQPARNRAPSPRAITRCARMPSVRIPTKPAMHSERKPATDSDLKPAGIPI